MPPLPPASIREKSSRLFTSFCSLSVFRCATPAAREPLPATYPFPAVLGLGPAISVSGVRNSWLTLLKKMVLARSISQRLGLLSLLLKRLRVGDRAR